MALVLSVTTLVACGGPKKKNVTKQDFQAVTEYVDRNMRAPAITPEERRKYTVSQLGGPHRVDGDVEYWYSTAADCYYLQLGEDGWASWGTGATKDCKKWGVKP